MHNRNKTMGRLPKKITNCHAHLKMGWWAGFFYFLLSGPDNRAVRLAYDPFARNHGRNLVSFQPCQVC